MGKVKEFKIEEGCVKIILENHDDIDMHMLEMIHKEKKALPCLPMKHEIGTFLYDTTQYISIREFCGLWEFSEKDIWNFLLQLFQFLLDIEESLPYVLCVDAIFIDVTREYMVGVVLPIHEHYYEENDWTEFLLELMKILQVQEDAVLGWLYRLSLNCQLQASEALRACELYIADNKRKRSLSYKWKRKQLFKHFDSDNLRKLSQYFVKQNFLLKTQDEHENVKNPVSTPRTATVALFATDSFAYLEQDGKQKTIAQLCKIGRGSECDYILTSLAVSLQHAQIEQKDRTWWIIDLASSNGTSVNEEALLENIPFVLHDGDVIQCADIKVIFHEGNQDGREK